MQAHLDLARSEEQLLDDRERLGELLGVGSTRSAWTVPASLPALAKSEPALDQLETFAVAHRLDLQVARAELGVRDRALSITKATRLFGVIEVGADIHREVVGGTVAGPSLRLELPIFDQGQARVARQRSLYRQAERELEALELQIRSEIRRRRAHLLVARASVEYYQSSLLPVRERIVALSQRHYSAMLLGVYQLLQAKQDEANTYREYIEAVRDYFIARSQLERAAGGPLPPAEAGTRSTGNGDHP